MTPDKRRQSAPGDSEKPHDTERSGRAPKTLSEVRAQRTITPQMRDQIAKERELLRTEIALRERADVGQISP